MIRREPSLYFATIGVPEAARLVAAWASSGVVPADRRRADLEEEVRAHVPSARVLSYASARGALAACLDAAGIGAGDEVLVSAFSCLAVPTAVLAAGATPVYVDVDRASLNTPPQALIAAMQPPVRAVIVQHTLGCAAEVELIAAAARERGIFVIEDCALAFGSRHLGRLLGTFGDAAVWSMELSKTITTGWGGVLCIRDKTAADRATRAYASVPEPRFGDTTRRAWQAALTGICYAPAVHRFGKYAVAAAFRAGLFGSSTDAHELAGRPGPRFVARLAGPQAALGAVQWRRLGAIAERSEANGRRLRAAVADAGLAIVGAPQDGDYCVSPRVSFLVNDRARAVAWFASAGIELGTWFDGPLSPPPADPVRFNYDAARYPNASFLARHIVNLPSHSRLRDDDVSHIAATLREYARHGSDDRAFIDRQPARC